MTDNVQLFDLRERKYPNQRGDSFRSLQVFTCHICNAKTNKVVMGGYPGYGVRAVCPNSAETWHHELEDKKGLKNPHHPASYQRELEEEIILAQEKIKTLAKDDIEGTPDHSLNRSVTNTRSYRVTK